MTDPAADAAAVTARLTAPGAEFEIVDGRFTRARGSLRHWLVDAEAFGEREHLVQDDQRITFTQFAARVRGTAARLTDLGVRPGDRVAVLGANSPAWVLACWAGIACGAVVTAGNAWWTPREAAASLQRAEPSVVLVDARRRALADGLDVPVLDLAETTADAGADAWPDVAPDPDDPAVIVYTSGTTGLPKGAVHSHRALLAIIEYHRLMDALGAELALLYGRPPRPDPRRFLMSMPLFHIASLHNLALPRLCTGDTIVIDTGRFDPDRVLSLVERERITNWAVVPTMARRILDRAGEHDLGSLTALSINSAPSAPALKDAVQAAIPSVQAAVVDTYGLTECGTAATLAGAVDLALAPGSVGRPVASVEVSVRDADGMPLPDDETGEVWVRSQFAMSGYWRDPDATARAITPDGWLRTGDLGHLHDGRLYLGARRSDLIIRGGENVYPAEVEAALDEHPDVEECAVFGVDDADLGQAVAAIVVGTTDVEALRTWLADRIAYYKIPAHWSIRTTRLPRTATGKIVRSGLRLDG
ncbi:MAG: class I adenylate-forming enzyme family protein [Jatrophihabitans sp.]|uniref:class I adenylate-forming enzyme family protein n=1 Tax=Jatrophihabitans sp. TaxID=1932789 RepID=UPI003F809FA2